MTAPSSHREEVALDDERFRALVNDAVRARREGRPGDAVRTLHIAADLWRGPPFADVPDGPAREVEAAQFTEGWTAALGTAEDLGLHRVRVAARSLRAHLHVAGRRLPT